jgi:DNA-binding GntR family transcriptional regulator
MAGYDLPPPVTPGYRDHVTRVIDGHSDVPPYLQMAAILREEITSGQIPPRRPVPSVTALQQETGLARGTIRKAIALLAAEGLVVVRPGWGTFVVPPGERRA